MQQGVSMVLHCLLFPSQQWHWGGAVIPGCWSVPLRSAGFPHCSTLRWSQPCTVQLPRCSQHLPTFLGDL